MPVLVPGFTAVAVLLDVQLTDMALLNGSLIMTLGLGAYLCPCIAEVYGKRMVYLVTAIIIVAGCGWADAANSYHSLLGARAIQVEFEDMSGIVNCLSIANPSQQDSEWVVFMLWRVPLKLPVYSSCTSVVDVLHFGTSMS